MTWFVDTSALFATLDADDAHHREALAIWQGRVRDGDELWTSSFVVAESFDLVRRRLGLDAVRRLDGIISGELRVDWIGEAEFRRARDLLFARGRRHLSLVDAVGITLCQDRKFDAVFAFNDDFDREGLPTVRLGGTHN